MHLDSSIPNFLTQEYSLTDEADHNKVYRSVLKREGGFIPVPEAPGLGVELDAELLAQAKHEPRHLHAGMPLRTDGSVAYSV